MGASPTTLYPARVRSLACLSCGAHFAPEDDLATCPRHAHEGALEIHYRPPGGSPGALRAAIEAGPRSMWRYGPLLPLPATAAVPAVHVGWTPLYEATNLGRHLGTPRLYLKDDSRNPTASLKDRASALAAAATVLRALPVVACASTGNAASSLAAMAASMGLRPNLLVPESIPEPKLAQLLIFGAEVHLVRGSYDDVFDLCHAACQAWGWYDRSAGMNPYLVEGKKTAALEILEQLSWDPPEAIVCSVGDGSVIGGLWKGLREAHEFGLIETLPRLIGVQAEGADPVARAWRSGARLPEAMAASTLADSIAVGVPRDPRHALDAVRSTGGAYVSVSDEVILEAMRQLARRAAVFAEPAAAAAVAGIRVAVDAGYLDRSERVVAVISGSGLKDVRAAGRAVARPEPIDCTLDALAETRAG